MMAHQNTFLCECGRVIGRPRAQRQGDRKIPSYGAFKWDFEVGDALQIGITCTGKGAISCRRQYVWLKPPIGHAYVNVRKVKS